MKIIDISEHNGNINFANVKKAGIEGVIIRAGWIGNKENHTLDKKFEEYYLQAKNEGLKVGFYVYSYCKTISAVESGAKWVINKIINKRCDLATFLDLEDSSISILGNENLTNQAIKFCNTIEKYNIKSGVYANKFWFENKLDINKLITFKIWLAEWRENYTANFRVDLWQYTSKGQIAGITGFVDLSKCINCQNQAENTEGQNTNNQAGGFEMKKYVNGSTLEPVFQDINCTKQIGYLNKYETCECYGIINNKALVVYNIDGTNNKKTGFVKWLEGIK